MSLKHSSLKPFLFQRTESPDRTLSKLSETHPNRLKQGDFRLLSLCLLLLISFLSPADSQEKSTQGNPNIDPKTGVIHSSRLGFGVPLGGIGAGNFQYLSDGTFGEANLTGGSNAGAAKLPGCFAAIRTRIGDNSLARVLSLQSDYKLPCVSKLDFDGLYPQANLQFPDIGLPVNVELKAFSPILPNDLKNSCFPAAAFIFRLQNKSNEAVEVSVALSWENLLGAGSVKGKPFLKRTGTFVESVPDSEGFFAMNMGVGSSLQPAGIDLEEDNSTGTMCLMTAPQQPLSVVTSAGWNSLDEKPGWWSSFEKDGTVSGVVPRGVQGKTHPAGVICVKLTLKPRETFQVPFAISWRLSHRYASLGKDYGRYYETLYPDSYSVAKALLSDWRSLLTLTAEWQNRLLYSDMPVWVVRRIINSVSVLTSHSVYTKDGRFLMLDSVGGVEPIQPPPVENLQTIFSEKGGERAGTALSTQTMLLDLFPELAGLQLREWMSQKNLGEPERVLENNLDLALASANRSPLLPGARVQNLGPSAPLASRTALENTSVFLILMAQYVRTTGDREFLLRYHSFVVQALNSLLEVSREESFPAIENMSPSAGTLFLSALLAAHSLSKTYSESLVPSTKLPPGFGGIAVLVKRNSENRISQKMSIDCEKFLAAAVLVFRKKFTEGGQVGRFVRDAGSKIVFVPDSDYVLGEWSATLFGSSLPELTLLNLKKSALSEGAGSQSGSPLKESSSVGPDVSRKANLNSNAGQNLALRLIRDGIVPLLRHREEAGIGIFKNLDIYRSGVSRTPWNSPSFVAEGDAAGFQTERSSSHAVPWNLLSALEGFSIDQEKDALILTPNIPGVWRTLRSPIFSATFWGKIEYKPTAKGGITTFRLDRLIALPSESPSRKLSVKSILSLKSVKVAGPIARPAGSAIELPTPHVSLGRLPIGVKSSVCVDGGYLILFETPLAMSAGDRLEVDLH